MLCAAAIAAGLSLASCDLHMVDGDTFVIDGERVRLLNVDTPEIHGKCAAEIDMAQRAKRYLAVLLRTHRVEIDRRGHDRYGRTLAIVLADGHDVGEWLIEAGLGRPYHGERRRSWCR